MIATVVQTGARNIGSPALWAGFLVGVLLLLALDLRISSRRGHGERFREAIGWSLFWIALSLGFGFWIWIVYGGEQGLEFFAGYLLEKSLSVDNLFVFVLLFQAFAIPAEYQHRVLFWGVLGALVLRGTLILAGVALVHRFHWIIAVFGAVLVYTAAKIALHRDDEEERAPADNVVVRTVRKSLPMTATIDGPAFLVRREGERYRVVGRDVERWVADADFEDPRSVATLQKRLAKAGVERALQAEGAKHGDDVVIGDRAFEFYPDADG